MSQQVLLGLTVLVALACQRSPAIAVAGQNGDHPGTGLLAASDGSTKATERATTVTLAEKGVAKAAIVVDPELGNWRETLAVKDLADYLYRVTGAVFPIAIAGQEKDTDTCIYVHRIAATKLGVDLASLDGQEWIVKTSGKNVYLTGGNRDGFLYAVYHFLEDTIGIHWWNDTEELIPQRPTLVIGPLDARHKPAFNVRQTILHYSRIPAHAGREGMFQFRNRASEVSYVPQPDGSQVWQYQARDITMPTGHALLQHVPASHFEKHPEWFAEVGGTRTANARDLCLTNPGVREFIVGALRENLENARASNRRLGSAEPYIVSLSREDNAQWCECAACASFTRQHSHSDLLLDFVNAVAGEVARQYPEVLLSFYAYQDSSLPPRSVKPAPNVMPVYCFEGFNEARPLDDPSNREVLSALRQWAAISKQSAAYIYHRTFQRFHGSYGANGHDFPCPMQLHCANDFRLLRSLGVTAITNENENFLTQDFRDMKVWLATKLMEDPDQDEGQLQDTYLTGYYGKAADAVKRYLTALQKADQRKPSRIWFFADLVEYRYLDLAFVTEANDLFNEAAQAVGEAADAWQSQMRLNHARLGLDRAILYNWPKLVREWVLGGHQAADFPFKREELLKRHETTLLQQMHLRAGYGGISVERSLSELRHEQEVFAGRLYWELPLPQRFAGTSRELLFDFPAQSGAFTLDAHVTTSIIPTRDDGSNKARSNLVDDPATAGGKAIEVAGSVDCLPLTWRFQPTWDGPRPTDRQIKPEQVQGSGYDWYDLGEYTLDGSNCGLVFFDGDDRVNFWGCSLDSGKYQVWAEMAFNAPNKSVRIGRIICIASPRP